MAHLMWDSNYSADSALSDYGQVAELMLTRRGQRREDRTLPESIPFAAAYVGLGRLLHIRVFHNTSVESYNAFADRKVCQSNHQFRAFTHARRMIRHPAGPEPQRTLEYFEEVEADP